MMNKKIWDYFAYKEIEVIDNIIYSLSDANGNKENYKHY